MRGIYKGHLFRYLCDSELAELNLAKHWFKSGIMNVQNDFPLSLIELWCVLRILVSIEEFTRTFKVHLNQQYVGEILDLDNLIILEV